MKLKYLFSAVIIAMLAGVPAKAAVGDVIGNIYTTDIAAYIDDMPVQSYNIGGKTAVVIENLRDYGFSVEWKEKERLLIAKTGYMPETPPEYVHKAQTPGKIAGKVYETDIRVIFNGIEVPSFNIGGLTAVAIEDMGKLPDVQYSYDGNAHRGMDKPYTDIGMYHIWNPDAKTISLYTLRPGSVVETEFGEMTIGAIGATVERITYKKSSKALGGMDGRVYTTYAEGIEIDGRLYMMLYDVLEAFGGNAEVLGDALNIKTNVQSAIQLRYADTYKAQGCQNILYPLAEKLSVNNSPANSGYADFYLYRDEVYVSAVSFNLAAGKPLLKDIDELPEDCTYSLGKILCSDHILYINGMAISSYMADNGEYYIPIDELYKAKFDILASSEMRNLKSPEELPEIILDSANYPENYFYEDAEGKGYLCEFYKGIHNVKIDDKVVSSVYLHFPDTYLTPCVALGEFVEVAGYGVEKAGNAIRIYTRADGLTMGIDRDLANFLIYKKGAVVKEFSADNYQDAGVFGDYLYLGLSGDMAGTTEIFSTGNFEKITAIKGTIEAIKNGRIFAYENTEIDGEWARRHFIYDMSGKLTETYIDDK